MDEQRSDKRFIDVAVQMRTAVGRLAGAYGFTLEQYAKAVYELENVARYQPDADGSHEWRHIQDLDAMLMRLRAALMNAGPLPTFSKYTPTQCAVEGAASPAVDREETNNG